MTERTPYIGLDLPEEPPRWPAFRRRAARTVVGLLAFVVGPYFVITLVAQESHIAYEEQGFEITCRGVIAGSSTGTWPEADPSAYDGADAVVTKGSSEFYDAASAASEDGYDLLAIQASLENDCADLRQARLWWAIVWMWAIVAFVAVFRRLGQPRPE